MTSILSKSNKTFSITDDITEKNNLNNTNRKSQMAVKAFFKIFKLFIIVLIALNILAPIVIYSWPGFISHVIFQHFIHIPFRNLSNPKDFGLEETYSFRINNDIIGAWHVLPKDSKIILANSIEEHFKKNIANSDKVVLYLHGNTNDRATGHRVGTYNLLSSHGFHVVTFDYRGYGDSYGDPTETNVVEDSMFMYDFLKNNLHSSVKLYLWGHSLGTGVSSKVARILSDQNRPADGLVLEAPFYNIFEIVDLHPFTLLFPYNPILFKLLEESLNQHQIEFRSDIHLTKVKSKTAIWHAEDDLVIPIFQSEKLYEIALKNGVSESLTYHRIPWYYNCGHRHLYSYHNMSEFIKSFIV